MMRLFWFFLAVALFMLGCTRQQWEDIVVGLAEGDMTYADRERKFQQRQRRRIYEDPAISEDVYGPGIHQDRYGRAVRYEVIGQPDVDTTFVRVKPNAYGPGVHMDQYGRAVRTVPWQ